MIYFYSAWLYMILKLKKHLLRIGGIMRLLVLATDYPQKNESTALMYIHTRNKYYVQNGIDVTVLNFKAKNNYTIDNVKVITLREYEKNNNSYDILVAHAPNLRNHYVFFKKYDRRFSTIVFFFHGHEVLKTSEIYPKPYSFRKTSSKLSVITHRLYDICKLKIWKKYFIRNMPISHFVFVSKWMYDMFIKYVQIDPKLLQGRKHIIYNSVGKCFETNYYDPASKKNYDFITIRNNLDGSKYAIDIVTKIALANSKYRFCVVGKGEFFNYFDKPDNLEWINKNLSHNEIIDYLNKSYCALMPTRADAQGVMACEIATFGIPIITSNIEVCREVFEGFRNVEYFDNESKETNIEILFKKIKKSREKNTKYFAENTIGKEVKLFNMILHNSDT